MADKPDEDVVYAFVKSEVDRAVREYSEATLKFSKALQEVAYTLLYHYNLSVKGAQKILEKYERSSSFDKELRLFMKNILNACIK